MTLTEVSSSKCFEGFQKVFSHYSNELKCRMNFAIYLPAAAIDADSEQRLVPVLYWLSGLECNELNFVQKSGFQRFAAHHNIAVVCPDTSPRGCGIAGEDERWDFGTAAGFYVDASQEPWATNYRMYSYVTSELPQLINTHFPAIDGRKQSIMGHSMGGHGALICALKNAGKYQSVSAFAPICHPSNAPVGRQAFRGYFGDQSEDKWQQWDATCLVGQYDGPPLQILIDQGLSDKFLEAGQLQPDEFVAACKNAEMAVVLKKREGYDHGYFFISTFIEEHFKHHAQFLKD